MTVLEATGLVVRRGRSEVLHGVELTVEPGEVVAVLGPNGAGKSTLLDAIGGLLPVRSGGIQVDGRVAAVRQEPGLARRAARANVELALKWWGVPRTDRRARAMESLTALGAEHLASRRAAALSGGERRRVHLARGVAIAPDVLLLDEPFAGLDPESHAAVRDDTTAALRSTGSAVVVVLHDRAVAWALADRLVVLMDGRVAGGGTPRHLTDAPPNAEVARFLGYDGELRQNGGLLLTRSSDVLLDPEGPMEATSPA